MKTRTLTHKKNRKPRAATPEYLTRNGRRLVVLEESEYERLRLRADEWEPLMPEPLPNGNYPAAEALAVIQARNILRAQRTYHCQDRPGIEESGSAGRRVKSKVRDGRPPPARGAKANKGTFVISGGPSSRREMQRGQKREHRGTSIISAKFQDTSFPS